jgi:hypothetical protein
MYETTTYEWRSELSRANRRVEDLQSRIYDLEQRMFTMQSDLNGLRIDMSLKFVPWSAVFRCLERGAIGLFIFNLLVLAYGICKTST